MRLLQRNEKCLNAFESQEKIMELAARDACCGSDQKKKRQICVKMKLMILHVEGNVNVGIFKV